MGLLPLSANTQERIWKAIHKVFSNPWASSQHAQHHEKSHNRQSTWKKGSINFEPWWLEKLNWISWRWYFHLGRATFENPQLFKFSISPEWIRKGKNKETSVDSSITAHVKKFQELSGPLQGKRRYRSWTTLEGFGSRVAKFLNSRYDKHCLLTQLDILKINVSNHFTFDTVW